MKRADLFRKLTELGYKLIRHGGRHDWYQNKEIKENLAKSIIKKLSPPL